MISYEMLQEKIDEHKPKIIYGLCLLLMFIVGFGTGNAWGPEAQNKKPESQYSNYTTPTTQNKAKPLEKNEAEVLKAPTGGETKTATTSLDATTCKQIKGNISSKSKIYHMPGGAFYDRTQAEQCFATEAEAIAAGFKKSSR
jgi:cell division protein FtsN